MSHRRIVIPVPAVLLAVTAGSGPAGDDPWRPFRSLVGEWRGVGSGFGAISDVTHEWNFAIRGKFIRFRTRSKARADGR